MNFLVEGHTMARAKSGSGDSGGVGSASTPTSALVGLALGRIFLGGFFLYSGILNIYMFNAFTAALRTATTRSGEYVAGNYVDGYANMLNNAINPHPDIAAMCIIGLELLVGALLLIGLLTRLAAAVAIIMNLCYLLAQAHIATPVLQVEFAWVNGTFIMLELAILLGAAGRIWGIDSKLARKSGGGVLW